MVNSVENRVHRLETDADLSFIHECRKFLFNRRYGHGIHIAISEKYPTYDQFQISFVIALSLILSAILYFTQTYFQQVGDPFFGLDSVWLAFIISFAPIYILIVYFWIKKKILELNREIVFEKIYYHNLESGQKGKSTSKEKILFIGHLKTTLNLSFLKQHNFSFKTYEKELPFENVNKIQLKGMNFFGTNIIQYPIYITENREIKPLVPPTYYFGENSKLGIDTMDRFALYELITTIFGEVLELNGAIKINDHTYIFPLKRFDEKTSEEDLDSQ